MRKRSAHAVIASGSMNVHTQKKKNNMKKLLIVTVNYRIPELTEKCLRSIANDRARLPEHTRMVVVDNDSGDGSYEKIANAIRRNGWEEWAEVVASGHNGGFAYGNNVAIRRALDSNDPPDYIWLLNPDAESLEGAGQALIDFLETHPKAGLATSRYDESATGPNATAFRDFSILTELVTTLRIGLLERLLPRGVVHFEPQQHPHPADWISGTSLMIRREVFDDIGLMDEGYFLYFEESDFCLQAQRHGWECWYVPESRILHVLGAATGFSHGDGREPRRPRYWFESRRRYFIKNFGLGYAMLADLAHLTGFALWQLRRALQQKPDLDPPHYLRDFLANSTFASAFERKTPRPTVGPAPVAIQPAD